MTIDLAGSGTVPTGLSGQFVHLSDGIVRAVRLSEGQASSYCERSVATGVTNLVSFGRSILAFGDGVLAYEFGVDLDAARRVDLAGAHRRLTAHPKVDPITGELHLLTSTCDPPQLHVRVSPGFLTRTIRSIDNAPSQSRQLELTRDNVVLLADGFVGVADRSGLRPLPTWFPIDTDARHLATVHADGETVVVYTTGPSLVRWTVDRRTTTVEAHVLDATPQSFASTNRQFLHTANRFLWTVGSGAVHKHDLFGGSRESHHFGRGQQPGEHVFVADPGRAGTEDGGWLVGFVHDETTHRTDLVVLDAQAIEQPAVTAARFARHISGRSRCTWIPTVQI
jgi:carotenoid cleavage dioxygenase-like enzyme